MNPLVSRLDAYLREHRPALYASLQPGLSNDELTTWEATLGGVPLPTMFKALYRWRNGQPRTETTNEALVFHYL